MFLRVLRLETSSSGPGGLLWIRTSSCSRSILTICCVETSLLKRLNTFPLPSPPPAVINTWLPSCISEACWEAENTSRSSRDSRSWRSWPTATGVEFYSATCRSPSAPAACPTCRSAASASCCPTTRATSADAEFNGYVFSNTAIENWNQLHLFVQNQADLSFCLQNITCEWSFFLLRANICATCSLMSPPATSVIT